MTSPCARTVVPCSCGAEHQRRHWAEHNGGVRGEQGPSAGARGRKRFKPRRRRKRHTLIHLSNGGGMETVPKPNVPRTNCACITRARDQPLRCEDMRVSQDEE